MKDPAREQLEAIRRTIAEQDERLTAACASLCPRDVVVLPPGLQQRFELLCAPPARGPQAAPCPTEWNALRC